MKQKTKFKQTEIGMIPEDWEVVQFNKIAEFVKGKKPNNVFEFQNKGYRPYILINLMNGGEKLYADSKDMISVNEQDILMVMDGASSGRVEIGFSGILGSTLAKIKLKNTLAYNKFLLYFLKLKETEIQQNQTGTAIPHADKSKINDFLINLPPFPEQTAIVNILSKFDDKIELLQKQNKTLEAIGQTLFKHWFVDFEFPNEEGKPYKSSGGKMVYNEELKKEISKGWEVDKMKNFSDANWGDTNITKKSYIEKGFLAYSASGPDGFRDKFDYEKEGIVLSAIGAYCGKTWYAQGKWSCIKNTIRIFGEKIPTSYLYFLTKKNSFWQLRGAAQPFISKRDIDNTKILVPPLNLLKKFDTISKNIFGRIFITNQEIQILSKTRDLLLPKLMSGKIRVPVEAMKDND